MASVCADTPTARTFALWNRSRSRNQPNRSFRGPPSTPSRFSRRCRTRRSRCASPRPARCARPPRPTDKDPDRNERQRRHIRSLLHPALATASIPRPFPALAAWSTLRELGVGRDRLLNSNNERMGGKRVRIRYLGSIGAMAVIFAATAMAAGTCQLRQLGTLPVDMQNGTRSFGQKSTTSRRGFCSIPASSTARSSGTRLLSITLTSPHR